MSELSESWNVAQQGRHLKCLKYSIVVSDCSKHKLCRDCMNINPPQSKKLKYFSAFSGIGGFDLGLDRQIHNAECVGFSEVDKYAIKIYEKHFPNRTNYGDIKKIKAETLPDFDIFCGGFPCQDVSIAGKRAGLCGARSGLFFEIIRIIRKKQPELVFLENVKGLLSSNEGWDFARTLIEMDGAGYDAEWQVLNSKNFGVPQNRERVFIIGHLRGKSQKPIFPLREGSELSSDSNGREQESEPRICSTIDSRYGSLRNVGETYITGVNNPSRGMEPRKDGIASTIKPQSGSQSPRVLITAVKGDLFSREKPEGQYGFDDENMFCLRGAVNHGIMEAQRAQLKFLERNQKNIDGDYSFTVDGANTGGVQVNSRIRRLTPLECERLQGYPDGWTEGISDTQRYKCLGNAVTVNVIEVIAKQITKRKY